MSDNSFLNASNIQKINKELNDLKSRKVLTDLLNQQIDQNEHLNSENQTLIMNQRKLLNLLQSKDRVIEEIKLGTISICDQGFGEEGGDTNSSTYRQIQIQSFQNKAQMMADHQWQIGLSKIWQGGLRIKVISEKYNLQLKHIFFEKLKDMQYSILKEKVFRQINMKNQQNQLLKLYSLFKVLLSLIYKRKKSAFFTLSQSYQRQIQEEHFSEEQFALVERMKLENQKNSPMTIHKQFYDLFLKNKMKKSQKQQSQKYIQKLNKVQQLHIMPYVIPKITDYINQKKEDYGGYKMMIKKIKQTDKSQICCRRLKAILIHQKDRISELLRQGEISQEQTQDFIKNTQIIVNTIQNDYNMKCREIDFLTSNNSKIKFAYEQEIEQLQQQLQDSRDQREQSNLNLQQKEDIESQFQLKCMEIEKLKEQSNEEKRSMQIQIDGLQEQQDKFQINYNDILEQLQEVQEAYDFKCKENQQIVKDRIDCEKKSEEYIMNLKKQLQESKEQGQESQQSVSQQIQQFENKYEQKCQEFDELLQEKSIQQRQYEETISKLQREIKQYKMNEEEIKIQLQNSEKRNETLKKEILQQKQFIKELEFEQEERTLEIETISKRISQLQNEKNNLQNNLELSVMNLKELKQSHDQTNNILTKTKDEKSSLFKELDDKENHINELNQKLFEADKKIREANRKASSSPNKQQERDDALKKLQKMKKEKDELQSNYNELLSKLQTIKQTNSELTREAIQLNQEKLQMNESIDNLFAEIESRENHKQILEDKIQKLLQKLEEKEKQLQKQSIKPELLQKITQDKLELDEENAGLKKELLLMNQDIEKLEKMVKKQQDEINGWKQKESQLKRDIEELNINLGDLTRERIGYLRDLNQKGYEVQKYEEENKQLKSGIDQYQTQIDDYVSQLDLFSKTFKTMENKIRSLEIRSENTVKEIDFQMNQDLSQTRSQIMLNQQQENIDSSNIGDQALLNRIDKMKNMYSKQN